MVADDFRRNQYYDDLFKALKPIGKSKKVAMGILRQIARNQREACVIAIGKFYDNWNRTHNEEEWSDADLFKAIRNAEIVPPVQIEEGKS